MNDDNTIENDNDDYSSFIDNEESEENEIQETTTDEVSQSDSELETETDSEEELLENKESPQDNNFIDIDGEKLTKEELKEALLVKKDYSEIQQFSQKVKESGQYVDNMYDNLVNYVKTFIPQEPPLSLLRENPQEYYFQKESRQQIISELSNVINAKRHVEQSLESLSQGEIEQIRIAEEKKIERDIPEFKTETGKRDFYEKVYKTAFDFGFSKSEINECVDSRILKTIYYASIGKRSAEKMKNAMHRVASKPVKNGEITKRPNNVSDVQNKQAWDKFKKSRSVDDALKINF